MKKRFLFAGAILLFFAGTAFVLLKGTGHAAKSKTTVPVLLERKASLRYEKEWKNVQDNTAVLVKKITNDPGDSKALLTLAGIYLQEARITGNYAYYNEAAMLLVSQVLEKDPSNFEALIYKTTVLLSRHQFTEALVVAGELKQKYPYSAYVYGVLVDTYVELGMYNEAIEAADKMISLRPDIRSYSRIAYLREIHGDIEGAIEAMKMAVEAGAPGDENTEWCRVQAGKLYEQLRQFSEASRAYTIALANRQNFPPAITGLARVAAAESDPEKALSLYFQADSLSSDHTIKEGIAEAYASSNQGEKARQVRKEILSQVKQMAKEGNEDMELAHAYMGTGDHQKALAHALKEYKRRPDNIEVNETIALVYHRSGDDKTALPFIERALRTNCKNPILLSLAAKIYNGAGMPVKAAR